MRYHGWLHDLDDDSLALIERMSPDLGDRSYLLSEGVSVLPWYPDRVAFDLSPNQGSRLIDSLPNLVGFHFVSEKLRRVIEEQGVQNVEFLPVVLVHRRGRPVERQYFLMNVIGWVDCIDWSATQAVMSSLVKTDVLSFDSLSLRKDKIPEDRKLFRLGGKREFLIVRDDLASAIREAGCVGANFEPMERFATEPGLAGRPELTG